MADEIRADYDQLQTVAGQFGAQSEAVGALLQKVKGSMSPLESGGWIGDAANAFFAEMESEVLPATIRLQQAMDEANRTVQSIVQTVRQAEEEARAPFLA